MNGIEWITATAIEQIVFAMKRSIEPENHDNPDEDGFKIVL